MDGCISCDILRGKGSGYLAKEYIVELEGGWMLSHFGGKAYLGQLILFTKLHRTDFSDLSSEEAKALGLNLRSINYCLQQYWAINYPEDPIELIHIAYLNETPYMKRLSGEELLRGSHIHLHLLTRTKEMGESLNYSSRKIGWHFVDYIDELPDKYRVLNIDDEKVIKLMNYLNNLIGK